MFRQCLIGGSVQPGGHRDKCCSTRPRLLVLACEDGAVHVVYRGSCSYIASVQFAAVGVLSVAVSPLGSRGGWRQWAEAASFGYGMVVPRTLRCCGGCG